MAPSFRSEYAAYLKSDTWRETRARFFNSLKKQAVCYAATLPEHCNFIIEIAAASGASGLVTSSRSVMHAIRAFTGCTRRPASHCGLRSRRSNAGMPKTCGAEISATSRR